MFAFVIIIMYSIFLTFLSDFNVLIHVNTYKLTIHIYGIHNDIKQHKQPEATVINVNRI